MAPQRIWLNPGRRRKPRLRTSNPGPLAPPVPSSTQAGGTAAVRQRLKIGARWPATFLRRLPAPRPDNSPPVAAERALPGFAIHHQLRLQTKIRWADDG